MKKVLLIGLISLSSFAHAQNGLENVIVEKYYVSDANDSIATDVISSTVGALPVGSVTYRIYLDMLPGYKFQAAYGVPGHELRIETSTLFFNNEDRGATSPTYTKTFASHNTVMLDSWLSVGAACANNFGILKTLDNGVSNVVNIDGALQNNDPSAGIPLTTQDGLIIVANRVPEPVTTVGISSEVAVFDNQNDGTNGPVFSTSNGSWAALNGAYGPDSLDNKVLIAQITTDGVFCFKLNIQIGTPSHGVENYVAENPSGNEIQLPGLTYCNAVGVNEVRRSSGPSFIVYPNPAQDQLKIRKESFAGKDITVNIYNILGGQVFSKDYYSKQKEAKSDELNIDISSFQNGLYLVELSAQGTISTHKIIKN